MSAWIAFNAYCYALYAPDALRDRADLRKHDLPARGKLPLAVTGTLSARADGVDLVIEPVNLRIVIRERYTEDLIFMEFAKQHATLYAQRLREESFLHAVATLRRALAKGSRHYVLNMLRASEYREEAYQDMVAKNIAVPFDDHAKCESLIRILYQIRCNVFHGEKVPGDANDDRLVAAATPVLLQLLNAVLEKQ